MKYLSRILKFVATGSLTILLSACYGVVQAMYGVPINDMRGVIRAKKSDATPIPGIKVSWRSGFPAQGDGVPWSDLGLTDPQGAIGYDVIVPLNAAMVARMQDVDGAANGGDFLEAVVPVDSNDKTIVLTTVSP